MIKSKVFSSEENLNIFDSSNRVLTISIETISIGNKDYIKLWYRELPPLTKKKNEIIPKS